jgi:hypothetical protein
MHLTLPSRSTRHIMNTGKARLLQAIAEASAAVTRRRGQAEEQEDAASSITVVQVSVKGAVGIDVR